MGKGMQVQANQDGRVHEAVGGSRIDERLDGDWRLTRDEEVYQKSEVTGGGEGERTGEGKGAALSYGRESCCM